MKTKHLLTWILRGVVLIFLYIPIWISGTLVLIGEMPETQSDPGFFGESAGILLLALINVVLIVALIVSSRWRGWKLALLLGLSYYGSFTFITQIETWYFLSELTVSEALLPRLFLMGFTVPFLFIPVAVVMCRRWKTQPADPFKNFYMRMPIGQFFLKLGVLSLIYVVLYWCAGYFVAWQNPELRAFYGSPGPIVPFWEHTVISLQASPDLFLLQLGRGLLFAIIVIPIILGSKASPASTAVLAGLLLGVPNLGHILANPLMPDAGVRLSHMIETAPSTFLFGVIVFWFLQRKHRGIRDLLHWKKKPKHPGSPPSIPGAVHS